MRKTKENITVEIEDGLFIINAENEEIREILLNSFRKENPFSFKATEPEKVEGKTVCKFQRKENKPLTQQIYDLDLSKLIADDNDYHKIKNSDWSLNFRYSEMQQDYNLTIMSN